MRRSFFWILLQFHTKQNYPGGINLLGLQGDARFLNCFSCIWLFATPWTIARQAPLSMGFSGQEYWSRLPCPSPGDLPSPGIKPVSLTSPTLASGSLPPVPPGKPKVMLSVSFYVLNLDHVLFFFFQLTNCPMIKCSRIRNIQRGRIGEAIRSLGPICAHCCI